MSSKSLIKRFIPSFLKSIYWKIHIMLYNYSRKRRNYCKNHVSSHIPVFIGISKIFDIKKILELGSGNYSTPLFLNREIFPNLEILESCENDKSWFDEIKKKLSSDERLRLNYYDKEMSEIAEIFEISEFDLIFVDDSQESVSRSKTIGYVSDKIGSGNYMVIHDYEVEAYRKATGSLLKRFRFNAFYPNTGIAWKNSEVSRKKLKMINKLIKENYPFAEPENIQFWNKLFIERLK